MAKTVRVAVTGAAGQVAYAMLGRLASGEVFGPDTKVILQLLEITQALPGLEGVAMELDDCGFPTLAGHRPHRRPEPRLQGLSTTPCWSAPSRASRAWSARTCSASTARSSSARARRSPTNAAKDVRILVVGNPCNTNCLVAYNNGRDIPAERWTAMTRLDHNRARGALAKKAGVG